MGAAMRWGIFFRVLFMIYCIEAGVFLVLAPWSTAWDRALLALPLPGSYAFWLHTVVRGMVCGFGLVHLVWGAFELDLFLTRNRRPAAEDAPSTRPSGEPAPAGTAPEDHEDVVHSRQA
jgi:hypothetical protein